MLEHDIAATDRQRRRPAEREAIFAFDPSERSQLRPFAVFGCGTFTLVMLGLAVSAMLRADWTILLLDLLAAAGGVSVGLLAWHQGGPRAEYETDPGKEQSRLPGSWADH